MQPSAQPDRCLAQDIRSFVRLASCLLCLLVTLTLSTRSAAAQQKPHYLYSVIQLPTLGGAESYGYAINEAGDVVGTARVPSQDYHATLWPGGSGDPIDLGTLGGRLSDAWAINSSRQIGGEAQATGQTGLDKRAFLWQDGRMSDLGTFGGDVGEALGINDIGHIAGWASFDPNSDLPIHACLWINGQMTDLGALDSDFSEAYQLNEVDQVVGQSWSESFGGWRAVLWDHGAITDLGTFESTNGGQSWAYGINDAGVVVGGADTDGEYVDAFVWYQGRMHNIGRLSSDDGAAYGFDINNHNQVVGSSVINYFTGNADSFIWDQQHGMVQLDRLIAPNSHWRFVDAFSNNDAGQIVGDGYRNGNNSRYFGYILSPVAPTLTLASAAPGVAGQENTITLSGAAPGSTISFYYSRTGGGAAIPGCTLQQNSLQIDDPKLIGTAVADSNGAATLTRFVPLAAQGRTLLIQAAVQGQCTISQLLVQEFE